MVPTLLGSGLLQKLCYNTAMTKDHDGYIIRPIPLDPKLTERVTGID